MIAKIRACWPLFKIPQTGMLVATGMAGYMSARCPVRHPLMLTLLFVSLVAAISGSTILNMWWDRDIDARMARTKKRPLPSGKIKPNEALRLGLSASILGVGFAILLNPLYGAIIFTGLFFDVAIYTMWLKRRTCWSIVWGGLSGGMPILAGRAFGTGGLDGIGILLSCGVFFWIPTHIMTFHKRYINQYQAAGVPTFPSKYGLRVTRFTIALSSILTALAMGFSAWGIGMAWGLLCLLGVLSIGLLVLAVFMVYRPSERVNFGLFKYASLYMLAAMVLMML